MVLIYEIFAKILKICYDVSGNFVLSLVFFTLFSKLVLLPVTVWMQFQSIKLFKLEPDINRIKIKHFGDNDSIAEEENRLYKTNGYNPFTSVVPVMLQLFLLMAVIGTIHRVIELGQVELVSGGIDLRLLPVEAKGIYYLFPLMAGISALLLSLYQNKYNILQEEQGRVMKWVTTVLSVGISLFLGLYVQAAVVIYWICSNIFSVMQQYMINIFINPWKYVDREELEKTRDELRSLESVNGNEKGAWTADEIKREKADYRRFFSIVNKHLVFYSESSGFYKYYQGIIEYLLNNTSITIHYITSDPNDQIFRLSENNHQIKPYFIREKKLITLMMKMDADIVVMTMPDLENYHIKRSYVRKDIEYIYVPHTLGSMNLMMRTASIDHFDTILLTGKHQLEETRKTEAAYKLNAKKLIECGYPLLDSLIEGYNKNNKKNENTILIAPSWQQDNIMDVCIDEMLKAFEGGIYRVILRPHPQYIKHYPNKIEALKARYENNQNIYIQTDFSSNDTVFNSALVITDWSGIGYEFAYTTYKPVLFINTPMKIMNPEYTSIDTVPINIWMRDVIGASIDPDQMDRIYRTAQELIVNSSTYEKKIREFVGEYVYNLGSSAEVASEYIIQSLKSIIDNKTK